MSVYLSREEWKLPKTCPSTLSPKQHGLPRDGVSRVAVLAQPWTHVPISFSFLVPCEIVVASLR
jgi:hypothetical protein